MATLAQRTQTVESEIVAPTHRLESILATFMERTDGSIERLKSSPRMSDAQAFARFLESGEFARHAGAQGFVHPALDGEVRDAGKLVDVAGDQRRPRRPGMSGDQKVVVADRATDPLQFGMGAAVGRRRLCVCVERRLRLYFPGYLPIVPAFSSLSIPGG